MHDVTNDFYEDDEQLTDVIAAFGSEPHLVTQPPLPAGAVLDVRSLTFACASATVSAPWTSSTPGMQLTMVDAAARDLSALK